MFTGVMAGDHHVEIDRRRNGGVAAGSDIFDVAPGATAQVELRAQ